MTMAYGTVCYYAKLVSRNITQNCNHAIDEGCLPKTGEQKHYPIQPMLCKLYITKIITLENITFEVFNGINLWSMTHVREKLST